MLRSIKRLWPVCRSYTISDRWCARFRVPRGNFLSNQSTPDTNTHIVATTQAISARPVQSFIQLKLQWVWNALCSAKLFRVNSLEIVLCKRPLFTPINWKRTFGHLMMLTDFPIFRAVSCSFSAHFRRSAPLLEIIQKMNGTMQKTKPLISPE